MTTDTDRAIIRLFRLILIAATLMLVVQALNVVLAATRSCPACASCPTAERP